ncbi:Pimeloyl-ACP methyl ester carboxylesterase [Mucilaginibacter mallensis]|uniref:Pimeloyl-ACP methyl ester carboxylesterase n=1 Tax=Mucilaginibacter mallensis TaxID=652787 RepID=A0A1H1P375_MUCMA|nr:alpha/beta hydrolase [Mucilaginibacter mallensis]SDS05465.1 Pimeloyl-ACP methyl ester carboxylesterase [Mucilaginibacter mallensis]
MKKTTALLIALSFILLCINVFGGAKTYPFHVKVSGKGKQVIVFIPGFACSGDVWDATKNTYGKNYTCYTLTMAGFAGVPAEATPSFKGWEDAIAAYITDNKINKPIIVGHSMGGGLALAIAADYPAIVSKIIVVDALPCLAAMSNPDFKSNPNNDCSPVVAKLTGLTDAQFYQMQLYNIPQLMVDTTHLKQVVNWSVTSDRRTFGTMYCDFLNTDLRTKIAGIKCPALILLESYFATFKPGIEAQYKNLTTAQLAYANKGKHFIMFDDTDWYNQQLAAFIK